ncbi:alginate lyase family protein [Microbacterium sp. M3]|uniref:Alginate lyase family protein n=1 Tax=Microbacterium arthrosphaerae TaxID=792652 RepID=A0ABU4H110_9MICO|nr:MULTISPECIES: alginate lyase family protein [Microbacterium]MDW4571579.1 alginate lyase family protein [Microbacterium arthrosphaerae]MDW7605434.1 alginate lyase family protein [Microbacterium sp. M3]
MMKMRWRASLAAVAAMVLVGAAQPALALTGDDGTFRDDFDTLRSVWTVAAGDWQASEGAARVVTPGSTRGSVLALTEYGLDETSTATATFRTEGGGATAWAGFTVHRSGTTDDYTQSGYTVLVRNNGELAVIKAAGNSAVTYLGTTPTAARPGTDWVTVTAHLDGDRLDVSLNGATEPALSVTDAAFDDGGFSLASHRDLRMVVDSVELTGVVDRDEPAPADCVAWSGAAATTVERGVVLNSPERIAEIGSRVDRGVEPQASAFDLLLTDAAAGMARTPAPPEVFFVPFFYNNPTAHRAARDGLQNDANTAYQLALAYRLTGDEAYGTHAASFIDAWTGTIDCVRTSEDSALAFSYHFPAFVFAAELLRGTPVWTEEGERSFAGFLSETATPVAGSILHRTNNWGSWALELTTASAAYLADDAAIAAAHTRATELLEHQIDANGHLPEEVTRNNGVGDYGIWYTHFSLLPLMLTAETLDAHGYDLHAYVNANGTGLGDAVAAASAWVAAPASFPYYTGDIAKLANVRTIDYLRAAGVIAHSMSYFELAANHYPSATFDALLAEEGPMTTIHSAPYLSLTHGGLTDPAEPGVGQGRAPAHAGVPGPPDHAGVPGMPGHANGKGRPQAR